MLTGTTRSMSLTACAVDEVTYAVSWVRASSAADAAQVAQALTQAQTANWRASAASGTATAVVSSADGSVVQAVVIGAPERWRQAQRAGHVEQFQSALTLPGARP